MTLGSTQPLAEKNTKNILGSNGRPTREAENITTTSEPIF
jgi:hypothetical protein